MKKVRASSFFMLLLVQVSCIDIGPSSGGLKAPQDTAFNSLQWKSGDLIKRGSMTDSLINSKILIDLSESQIIELLGKPSENYSGAITYLINPLGDSTNQYLMMLYIELDTNSDKAINAWVTD